MKMLTPRLFGYLWLLPFALAQSVAASPVVEMGMQEGRISWKPSGELAEAHLRVTGPQGFVFEKRFVGAMPVLALVQQGRALADGQYNYEIVMRQPYPADVAAAFENAQLRADGGLADTALAAKIASYSTIVSGTFRIGDGTAYLGQGAGEESSRRDAPPGMRAKDQVIADDLIVQGSACFGFDCVNNESFGFDTIRLKENNLRIKFEDTSVGAFPSNDWQLTANDSASGGANKFSIEDVTGSKIPFTVTAGAPTNSVFVDSSGRLGLRTGTPVLDVHVATGNTPALRLEQNSSGGFTAQTWDIAGNEANFFIRDVTGGSRLPFRIRPGAPTSSLDIAASGNVGIGTASPSVNLHVSKLSPAQSDAVLRLSNSVSSWDFKNNASGRLNITDDTTTVRIPFKIAMGADNNLLRIGVASASTVDVNGVLTVNGTFNNLSSRAQKNLLPGFDVASVLQGVARLPLYAWSYKHESGIRHFGPTAEDFFSSFGLGTDDRHISPSDVAGVALAATQALNARILEKDNEILDLKARISRLEELLGRLTKGSGER